MQLFAGALILLGMGKPANAASPVGDVVGKVSVGYQGWFGAIGDGSPQNVWWHWSLNWGQPPSPSNNGIKAWPDMSDYTTTYQTAFANCPNGQAAKLFSSYDQSTVNAQVLSMQQNGIDTIALQRFNPAGEANRDGMATRVRTAAETYSRKFYIMYDITGWETMDTDLKTDWTTKMSALTASSAYAKQNGKPVVCIWLATSDRPVSELLDVINWFKGQGCYVIGGVERGWRTDSAKISVCNALNMLSPWLIGSIGSVADADNYYTGTMLADQAYCNSNGIDFQPCVLPGDVSTGNQRVHGGLEWEMLYNAKRSGCQGIYISMFDEFNEGNQICKTADTTATIPSGSGFLALNQDGTYCTSDYYLRLTGAGDIMFKGLMPLSVVRPTNPGGAQRLLPGTTVSLKALANGEYVCADNAGTNALIANRTSVGQWESFQVVDAGNGNIAFLALANNKYVTAGNAAGPPILIANRTAVGAWETFTEVDAGNGNIGLLATANGKYVTAENAGASPLIANRTSVGSWESFTVGVISSAGVVFYSDTQYGGTASQSLGVGTYTESQLTALGCANHTASSVKIPSGRTVILYSADNFGGTSWTLTANTPDFTTLSPSANDQMSSCKVQ